MSSYRVIIPTFEAEEHLSALLPALAAQNLDPANILVIDSSSKDNTVKIFKDFGAQTVVIPQSKFNHGGTRRMAVERCADSPFLILLTQDAIPFPKAFEQLLASFDNEQVGMAYGRQLPRVRSGAIERHARLTNYPPRRSEIRRFSDREQFGVKTTFSSNSFAAYRTRALLEVGNFPQEAFFGEDQITAGKMLLAGWQLAYVSEAEAVHSHGYGILDELRRYFDVGVFHSRNRWLLETFGKAEGEGLRFIKSELAYLAHQDPFSIPSSMVRTLLKYVGYRLGMAESSIPTKFKIKLSMAPYYWSGIISTEALPSSGKSGK